MSQEQDDGWSSTVICTFTRKGGGEAMLREKKDKQLPHFFERHAFPGLEDLASKGASGILVAQGRRFPASSRHRATEKGGLGGYVYCDYPGVHPANLEASVLANNCWPQGPDLTVEPSGGY